MGCLLAQAVPRVGRCLVGWTGLGLQAPEKLLQRLHHEEQGVQMVLQEILEPPSSSHFRGRCRSFGEEMFCWLMDILAAP